MSIPFRMCRSKSLAALATIVLTVSALAAAEPELVNLRTMDPTIAIELRYAGPDNVTQRALYPPDMQPLVRPSVAVRLMEAQSFLQVRGYRLKIWDAYRPKQAQ